MTVESRATIVKYVLNNTSVDRVFHALSEPMRRALVERLSGGPMSVSHLAQPFDVTLAAIVQHLQVLEESGIIRSEKVGRVRTCHLDPDGLKLAERWISDRRSLWERRLDRLGELLAEDETIASRKTSHNNRKGKRRKP